MLQIHRARTRLLRCSIIRTRLGGLPFSSFSSREFELGEPPSWYEECRKLERTVTFHMGPTNSGKTYQALEQFKRARSGIYCGPLRLLAWEIHEKLQKGNILCNLITGNELIKYPNSRHIACTVEMVDLKKYYDIAIIDEIQLIGDDIRGWAWTNAFLGILSDNIHVCGSPAALPIIESLCRQTGDKLIVKKYNRLSPLKISKKALLSYKNIQPGDCIVGFSRSNLFSIKQEIETIQQYKNKLKCCVIYGSLPPIARKDQAKLFSSPANDYSCLVATDAIGMGLNLAIRRIIFSTLEKFDGVDTRSLTPSEVKQIAGRAGRFQTDFSHGEVTCLESEDMSYLRQCMETKDVEIQQAGVFPSMEQMELLSFYNDFKLTDAILQTFWMNYFEEKESFDKQEIESLTNYYQQHFTGLKSLGLVLRHFESIRDFAKSVLQYVLCNQKKDYPVQRNYYYQYLDRIEDMTVSLTSHPQRKEDVHFDDTDEDLEIEELLKSYHKQKKEYKAKSMKMKMKDPFEENSLNHENEMKFTTTSSKLHRRDGPPVDDNHHQSSPEVRPIITYENIQYVPQTSITELLQLFVDNSIGYEKVDDVALLKSKQSDMPPSSRYFICNIDETLQISKIVDRFGHNISFYYKFVLCKAPVDPDNADLKYVFMDYIRRINDGRVPIKLDIDYSTEKLMETYSKQHNIDELIQNYYASQYPQETSENICNEGESDIIENDNDNTEDNPKPKPKKEIYRPKSLLQLESCHRQIDLYMWLSHRLPGIFDDLERSKFESIRCSSIINSMLTTMVFTQSRNKANKRSRK